MRPCARHALHPKYGWSAGPRESGALDHTSQALPTPALSRPPGAATHVLLAHAHYQCIAAATPGPIRAERAVFLMVLHTTAERRSGVTAVMFWRNCWAHGAQLESAVEMVHVRRLGLCTNRSGWPWRAPGREVERQNEWQQVF